MVTRQPAANTIAAASGSHQMLNSAAGVMFPRPAEPPMMTRSAARVTAAEGDRERVVDARVAVEYYLPWRVRLWQRAHRRRSYRRARSVPATGLPAGGRDQPVAFSQRTGAPSAAHLNGSSSKSHGSPSSRESSSSSAPGSSQV